jgi:DNA-binding transcriptional LysR family regulator
MIYMRRNILDFHNRLGENPNQTLRRLQMTLWQLQAFATVAKEGSFTKAGKVLSVSQPSVSALVIGLEKELKVKLFEKLGMRPHLTEAGSRLLKLAETVLTTVDKIPDEMEQVSGLKKGSLAVGGSGFAGATLLPIAVQAFKKKFPSIEVKVTIQRTEILEEKLLNGELDVALMGGVPRSRLIDAKLYREDKVVAIAPPNHPLAKRRSVPLDLLAKEAIIAEQGSSFREKVEELFAEKGLAFLPELDINVAFSSRDAIRSAVANGLGIAFVTQCHVLPYLEAGRIKILKVPELKLKRVMYVTFHKRRQRPLTQMFIDFLGNYKKS